MDEVKKPARPRRRRSSGKSAFRRPKKDRKEEDFINPIDLWAVDVDEDKGQTEQDQASSPDIRGEGLCVLGTDAQSGKTIATCAMGVLLQHKKITTAAFKPIEYGGQDNAVFAEAFGMEEFSLRENLYTHSESSAPYFVFKKTGTGIDLKKITQFYQTIRAAHAVTFVEMPGGLMEPLSEGVATSDLIEALGLDVLVVAPLRPSSLNHVLQTIALLKERKVTIRGIVLTESQSQTARTCFLPYVEALRELTGVPVVGVVPFLEAGSSEEILRKCDKKISFKVLLGLSLEASSNPDSARRSVRSRRSRRRPPRKSTDQTAAAPQDTGESASLPQDETPKAQSQVAPDSASEAKPAAPKRRRRSRAKKRPAPEQ